LLSKYLGEVLGTQRCARSICSRVAGRVAGRITRISVSDSALCSVKCRESSWAKFSAVCSESCWANYSESCFVLGVGMQPLVHLIRQFSKSRKVNEESTNMLASTRGLVGSCRIQINDPSSECNLNSFIGKGSRWHHRGAGTGENYFRGK
jgi:hypothetical protein